MSRIEAFEDRVDRVVRHARQRNRMLLLAVIGWSVAAGFLVRLLWMC